MSTLGEREYKLRLAKRHKGAWTREVLERAIRTLEGPGGGRLDPFCQAVIYELRVKLAKLR